MLFNTAAIILLLSAIALIIKAFLNFDQEKLNDLNRVAPSADLTGFYLLCAINPLALSAVIRKVRRRYSRETSCSGIRYAQDYKTGQLATMPHWLTAKGIGGVQTPAVSSASSSASAFSQKRICSRSVARPDCRIRYCNCSAADNSRPVKSRCSMSSYKAS